ncbi:hypothetical protein ABZV75_25445 [Streptomyces flaveolus]|uniref:hypothetical protein n=1 Tax=Streptomyces flaveolus TaxID=67297 RepID=UPI0033B4EC52
MARAASVSHGIVYTDGVREHIEAARRRPATPQGRAASSNARAGTKEPAGWKVEKQLLQDDNRRLRQEAERLKGAVRRRLGQQLDQFRAADDLGPRVAEPMRGNHRPQGGHDESPARIKHLTEQLMRSRATWPAPGSACTA